MRPEHFTKVTSRTRRVSMDSAIDDRDAGICETGSGALLVTTFTSLTYESRMKNLTPEQQAKWDAVERRIT